MIVKRFIAGMLETNCYIATCEKTGESVVIDPGDISDNLMTAIENTHINAILLTHGHFDHIGGVDKIANLTGAEIYIHEFDHAIIADPSRNGAFMIGANIKVGGKTVKISGGESITFGETSLKAIHTPGHTKGCVSYVSDNELVFSGDTLFKLSIGRWDFPGGSYQSLIKSLAETFRPMSDNVIVYPGHGETTTIGYEKSNNPYMNEY